MFEVGDRIKVIANLDHEENNFTIGKTGTIVHIQHKTRFLDQPIKYSYTVRLDDMPPSLGFNDLTVNEKEIELISKVCYLDKIQLNFFEQEEDF
jgi:hypothetical protein